MFACRSTVVQCRHVLRAFCIVTFERMSAGGALIGYFAGWIERQLMKLLRYRGDTPAEELALSVASAYFIFYIANGPGTQTYHDHIISVH